MDFQAGATLLLNKPLRWTSFDLVKKIRNITGTKKVGHAGTLDPLATGLVIICTGNMTRKLDEYQAGEKEYTGSFFLGESTPGYDRELPPDSFYPTDHITTESIYKGVQQFIGVLEQYPPPHSAVKINGKRAYELARQGREVNVKLRTIEVREFEITEIRMPLVYFRIVCSKGTYIRSLAHDFGKTLGSGACLESLCRTRIGSYRLEDALTIEQFMEMTSGISQL